MSRSLSARHRLLEVDRVEVLCLFDNVIDGPIRAENVIGGFHLSGPQFEHPSDDRGDRALCAEVGRSGALHGLEGCPRHRGRHAGPVHSE